MLGDTETNEVAPNNKGAGGAAGRADGQTRPYSVYYKPSSLILGYAVA
jgi:hypothetical protein